MGHLQSGSIRLFLLYLLVVALTVIACSPDNEPDREKSSASAEKKEKKTVRMVVPPFNADSAYSYIRSQVEFGPRIPGSAAHQRCATWLEEKFRSFGLEVIIQKGVATTYDKKRFNISNVIASHNPDAPERVLLCAHWDTRPYADRDEGEDLNKPFDGANDGASGVGVLLEIARQVAMTDPAIGIDFILFDLEDYGNSDVDDSWCLGAQYWAKNLHKPGYYARFGILLDMVGAAGAQFPKEGTSRYFASGLVNRIWRTAEKLGHGNKFIDRNSNPTTDDHLYVNREANIPCVVIVHYDPVKGDYFPHHHRVTDNMENIDKGTLKAVGETVMNVVFEESASL
jgi:Zn-dependent M28 family amino/carboxypeptidase